MWWNGVSLTISKSNLRGGNCLRGRGGCGVHVSILLESIFEFRRVKISLKSSRLAQN